MALSDWGRILCGGFAMAVVGSIPASASFKISSDPTKNINCSGGVCTATAKKAVLNANDLLDMLASGDVAVQSGGLAQDIEVDAALSWTSTHRLTLDSYHGISFNKPVVVAGTGALTLTTNDGGSGGDFRFLKRGHVEFWDLSSSLIINGQSYALENKLKRLARDIKHYRTGNFALAKSINEKNHQYFGSPIPALAGNFEGLGNAISNLSISSDDDNGFVGLFGEFVFSATPPVMRDIGLLNITVVGQGSFQSVGTLVGYNNGVIENCFAEGSVLSTKSAVSVGGLVGSNDDGTIENSFADVTVSSPNGQAVGGLVGWMDGFEDEFGIVRESYSLGTVTGGDSALVGGLIGKNWGGVISDSYAVGSATGGANALVGGLVGGNIDNQNGQSIPAVSASYSIGSVSGGSGAIVGGLIGQDAADSQIADTYWDMDTSGISDPHLGAGNIADDPGITGLTTEQFKSGLPAGFSPAIWKEKASINNGYPYLIANPSQ
jgi:hypothetical protein